MMKIFANLEEMASQVANMKDLSDEYHMIYGQLFSKIDESSGYWQGKDQETYVMKFHQMENDFEKLYQLLTQYTDFLEKSIQSYRMCQEEAAASSLRLM